MSKMVVNRFLKFSVSKFNSYRGQKSVSSIWPIWVPFETSALQTLHKVSSKAREQNYFLGGVTHDWVSYYEHKIESDRSCLNEWHAMDSLESRRPPSPDSVRTKPRQRDETERVIRATLKEIMMSVDLDEVTSKYIRSRLEEHLDMDLGEFKSFIDQEMLVILGQMDAPTEIFEHVYLGSEWNASNLEELQKNGVGHILNVTREIDNFFPGMFNYLNIRVYDDEKTDLLKHWDNTFKYISRAKKEGSKVLVHCKMGVSRSASVVIAYAMKAYNWDFAKAMQHVKDKRTCIKPNTSFLAQLETYQGILDAMKNKEKLQRSKSETNLKSPVAKSERIIPGSEPTPMIQALHKSNAMISGQELRMFGGRPKSWSPDNKLASTLLPPVAPTSVSLEHLNKEAKITFTSPPSPSVVEIENRYVLMPCQNGLYSVSPNHIFHLPCRESIPSVKHRVNELESQQQKTRTDKKGLVLNLMSHFDESESKLPAVLVKKWDPGEEPDTEPSPVCDLVPSVNKDIFSNQLDRVFDREDKVRDCPSRQSSWSSYDSAVVLNEVRDVPSRQSSWTSSDARILPSRNSSWGSYDMKPDTIFDKDDSAPGYPGTVKRTKQKIDKSDNVTIKLRKCNQWSRLSVSAPNNSTVLPICIPSSNSVNNIQSCGDHVEDSSDLDSRIAGIVKSLKRTFEAKTTNHDSEKQFVRSLPASPISTHVDLKVREQSKEDLSVKKLVGKYEEKKEEPIAQVDDKKYSPPITKKSLLVRNLKNEFKRPPVPPTVVKPMLLATVVTNAANKKQQQHGKTHPLSRLTINKQRHPVYNTM